MTFEQRPELGRENSRLRKQVKSPQGRNSFAYLGTLCGRSGASNQGRSGGGMRGILEIKVNGLVVE